MPDAITIGPLLLATDRLLALVTIALFLALAALADKFSGGQSSRAATTATLLGLLAGRAGYVAVHRSSYSEDPLSALAIWQGGLSPAIGIATALAALIVLLRPSRALFGAGAALAISVAIWLAAGTFMAKETHGPFPRGVTLWTKASEPLAFDAFRGQPFVVNLWATWCGPCRRELPMLARAAAARDAVPILLVNQGENAETVDAYLKREGVTAEHVILDPSRDLSRAFRTAGYPATAFVSADGTIVRLQLGELSRAALDDGIAMAEADR